MYTNKAKNLYAALMLSEHVREDPKKVSDAWNLLSADVQRKYTQAAEILADSDQHDMLLAEVAESTLDHIRAMCDLEGRETKGTSDLKNTIRNTIDAARRATQSRT